MDKATDLKPEDFYAGVLHLPYRKDRERHYIRAMYPVLQASGFNPRIQEAVKTNSEKWNAHPYKKMYTRTPGAIGCMLGQIRIMQEAEKQGLHAFVMEDDLIFCEDFSERLKIIFDFLNSNEWDVFFLGGTVHINPPYWHTRNHENLPTCNCKLLRDAERTQNPYIFRSYGSFSTHAYLVNVKSISKITEALFNFMPNSIGIDYSFIALGPSLKNYTFLPGSVIQIDNASDIGKGLTVFSNFKILGPHWFAKRLQDFNGLTYNWAETKQQ